MSHINLLFIKERNIFLIFLTFPIFKGQTYTQRDTHKIQHGELEVLDS